MSLVSVVSLVNETAIKIDRRFERGDGGAVIAEEVLDFADSRVGFGDGAKRGIVVRWL